jgi:DNA segregation ATPase FtsK/SpoIIIE, S-DNA-T family
VNAVPKAKDASGKSAARAMQALKPKLSDTARSRLRESALVLLLPVAVYLLVCLASYSSTDPSWSHQGSATQLQNLGGKLGAYGSDLLFYLLGWLAYIFPLGLIYFGLSFFRKPAERDESSAHDPVVRGIGLLLLVAAGCALLSIRGAASELPAGQGGILGGLLAKLLAAGLGNGPGSVAALLMSVVGLTLATGLSWLKLMDKLGDWTIRGSQWGGQKFGDLQQARRNREVNRETPRAGQAAAFEREPDAANRFIEDDIKAGLAAQKEREEARKAQLKKTADRVPAKIEAPQPVVLERSQRAEKEVQMPLFRSIPEAGNLPPLMLLDEPKTQARGYSMEELEQLSKLVEIKLKEFRIEAQVMNAFPGPVITRFEMQPAPGIRASQISSLDRDIARGLSKVSVRVVEVIAGKTFVGLEIPNVNREIVYLSEILRSTNYDKMASPLALALGKDIGGKPVVVDIQKMPHLLVAGTTGSGKSVALNAMILSLLYKATAEEVRMIMIDPKMLELSVYDGIPHLLAPVVTDMKEAANALRWCVAEMERRYKLMAAVGVRNLGGFNRKVKEANDAGKPIADPLFNPNRAAAGEKPDNLETLPYIVVVIDEFADMMMIVGKKVEELIARLAQKARAAGVHLILATQRPSVDVITGLIKANIPTRIAFQVSSKIDSRTILDQSGAETLLGHGDMLYLPPGTASPERVHGAFVDDHEVHNVVSYLKQHFGAPNYIDGITEELQDLGDGRVINESGLPESAGGETDVMYDQAVRIVTESRKASISSVQRRLKIGYNRAARLIEEMEAAGIVTAPNHQGNREVIAPPPPSL